mmetsp:Transcript_17048/g.35443  ORF Transcript_17048/g.35443 Transcript_17048/m.35443 type:complete len:325 (-) Transcript_17048:193-1167(-)|eukprot:CAMPEP_0184684680 /NCGR_PEP_ID=MMETSP0312-20130426/16286_1 /TAXON_ID=31354 /ORGANISM="Compsopogon coeruleus, Strain SAG 36.94" /LENGTH=324 /DNA_ID=CAMNT_0027138111 /DNA_START=181 /DNA_END=1155 /DNA_ORIENTATION=+
MGNKKAVEEVTEVAVPARLTFPEKLFAGAVARGVAQTFLHPIDVVRTRLQAKDVQRNWKPAVFFKGVIPQIVLAIPSGGVQFMTYELAKEKMAKWDEQNRWQAPRDLLAGALGALVAMSFRVPQEVIKQGIQADLYPNVMIAVPQIWRAGGFLGFYKGIVVTASRDVPWNALSFLFHAQAKRIFASVNHRAPTNGENLGLAGLAGALAAIIMTPVDVIKTRLMTQKAGAVVQYSGIIPTLKKIVAEEGPASLFKGVIPRILFLAPLAGIAFTIYEAIARRILRERTLTQAPRSRQSIRPPHRKMPQLCSRNRPHSSFPRMQMLL